MSPAPDYAALAKMIPGLRCWPDALSETVLDDQEARRIRSFGFAAEAGRWKVPPISPELVALNRLPEHLSIGWDSRKTDAQSSRENGWSPALPLELTCDRQVEIPSAEWNGQHSDVLPEYLSRNCGTRTQKSEDENPCIPPLEPAKIEETLRKVVRAIETAGGRAQKRRVQQGAWRAVKPNGASLFRRALRELLARGVVRMDGSEVVIVDAGALNRTRPSPQSARFPGVHSPT